MPTQPLDPEVVRVYDLTTAEAGWVWDDNVPRQDVDAVCARASQHASSLRAALGTLTDCAGKGGLPKEPPPLDPTTVGTLVMTAIANQGRREVVERARPLLEERLRAEQFPAGKVLLIEALVVTRMLADSGPDELEQLMMEAVRASPRAVDWPLLLAFSNGQSRTAIARAAHAWAGGRAFAKGDVAAALKAWRSLFRVTGAAVLLPFDALLKLDPDGRRDSHRSAPGRARARCPRGRALDPCAGDHLRRSLQRDGPARPLGLSPRRSRLTAD
ncbi:MAG: hypothetical protein IPM79_38520 [Polyangiaceae bacterium]|nr:hypothetical protein [Polyangiaceae bacterium]MBK8943344.1 hypothetical protein [Polyangiaceae bacterium]